MGNEQMVHSHEEEGGILLINKPKGSTSFSLVGKLRRRLGIKKIGHAGTLDPFATGVMVFLVGRKYTRLSDKFLNEDKEYLAQVHLGITTDTYDPDGTTTAYSEKVPTEKDIERALEKFQGQIEQIPPMFSAKKIGGKKLYELARKGKSIPRKPALVQVKSEMIGYTYPFLALRIQCSKGTYVRSIADELGAFLGCGAHLSELERTRSGSFHVDQCLDGSRIDDPDYPIEYSTHLFFQPQEALQSV